MLEFIKSNYLITTTVKLASLFKRLPVLEQKKKLRQVQTEPDRGEKTEKTKFL